MSLHSTYSTLTCKCSTTCWAGTGAAAANNNTSTGEDRSLGHVAGPVHVLRARHVDAVPVDGGGLAEHLVDDSDLHGDVLKASKATPVGSSPAQASMVFHGDAVRLPCTLGCCPVTSRIGSKQCLATGARAATQMLQRLKRLP